MLRKYDGAHVQWTDAQLNFMLKNGDVFAQLVRKNVAMDAI
jgi:hypothetical protein